MQITSVRSVILFHHVMSISIRQQSKQQLIFQRRTMKLPNGHWTFCRYCLLVLIWFLFHAEFAPVCIYVFLISLAILTTSRSSLGVDFEHFFGFIGPSRGSSVEKHGSSVVRHLPLVLEVPGSIPARGEKNFGVRTRFL